MPELPAGKGFAIASPSGDATRGGRVVRLMASHRERRQAHRQIRDFQKTAVYYLVSRKMVHSAMVASFRQSDGNENAGRRRPPDCDPGARAPIAHPYYDLNPYDHISPETAEKRKNGLGGRRNPLKRLD